MFLLQIRVSQTCFKIALTWSSSKGRFLDTQWIHQEQFISWVLQFPPRRMVNPNNGKENMIIRLNRTMERKICLNTYFRGISFPRTSRMISMTGYNVENPLGKGREIS